MTYEIVKPKQIETEWMPGIGDVHVYDGAISTGPQYLDLEADESHQVELDPVLEDRYPTIGEASREWARKNVAEELSPAQAMIAWAFAV